MDNENTVLTDAAETTETSMAFDDGWADEGEVGYLSDGNDTDGDAEEDSLGTGSESEETEADADQQDAEGTEGETTDGAETEGTAEGDKGNPDQGETYELRYLGETRTVDRDEVVKLAQQGMDYPRIREKWDSVKEAIPRLRMFEGFLRELAGARVTASGRSIDTLTDADIDDLIDETRIRSMIAQAEAKGERLSAPAAAARAARIRAEAMEPEEKKRQAESDEEKRLQRKGSLDRFMANYGQTVRSEDIPPEVWEEAERIGDLSTAWERYNNTKLEAENKRLKEELDQAKQQQKNKERSMGSSKSVGSAAAKDSFMEGWDDL